MHAFALDTEMSDLIMVSLDRRAVLGLFASGIGQVLAGEVARARANGDTFGRPDLMYAALTEGKYVVPAIPYSRLDPSFYRQRVASLGNVAAGTIVVDTKRRFLYLGEGGGSAIRYGIGIGGEGFAWSGEGIVERQQAWPRWTPPAEMLARKPGLSRYVSSGGSMAPGLSNPLGARALYIYQDGRDTLYRIHGTPEWQTIGKAVSSGCIRLINQDIIDLYRRTSPGARVRVT